MKEKMVDLTPCTVGPCVRKGKGVAAHLMMKAPLTSRSFRSLLNLLRRLIMNL